MKTRVCHHATQAKRLTLKMKNTGVQEYAVDFLAIFNTVREWGSQLIEVTNDRKNCVYVSCTKEAEARTREFLEQFGEILEVETILYIEVDVEYDIEKYADVVIKSS